MKTDSLITLIREQVREKGRPLKIICDWDEVIQPIKPWILYGLSSKTMSYKDYFKRFWERADILFSDYGSGSKMRAFFGPGHHYSYIDPHDENEKMNIKNERAFNKFYWEKIVSEKEKERAKRYVDPKRYEVTPFLSIAEDLFFALKEEGLIGELVFFTSRLKLQNIKLGNQGGKEKKFTKTFRLFPNTKLEFMEVVPRGEGKPPLPYRWHWIAGNHCDFDIMIDDHPVVIDKTKKLIEDIEDLDRKIFVVPDYKCTKYLQAPNIYHVKQEVSDLKDEDFVKAAQEYKQKHLTKSAPASKQERERERERENIWKQPALYLALGIGICLLGMGIYWALSKKTR